MSTSTNTRIPTINEAYKLVITSHFFLIPALVSYFFKMYFFTITSTITSIVSINYWLYPIPGFRRDLDLIVSKTSFGIYFINGFVCSYIPYNYTLETLIFQTNIIPNNYRILPSITDKTIGYTTLFCILICYYLSDYCWKHNHKEWIYFHILFHFFSSYEQLFIITSLCNK